MFEFANNAEEWLSDSLCGRSEGVILGKSQTWVTVCSTTGNKKITTTVCIMIIHRFTHEPFFTKFICYASSSSPSIPNVKHTSFSFQDNFWNTILFVQENNSSSQKLSFEGFMAWLWIMGTPPIGRARPPTPLVRPKRHCALHKSPRAPAQRCHLAGLGRIFVSNTIQKPLALQWIVFRIFRMIPFIILFIIFLGGFFLPNGAI